MRSLPCGRCSIPALKRPMRRLLGVSGSCSIPSLKRPTCCRPRAPWVFVSPFMRPSFVRPAVPVRATGGTSEFGVRANWAATRAAERDGWEPSTPQTIECCIWVYLLPVMLAAEAAGSHRLEGASAPDRRPIGGRVLAAHRPSRAGDPIDRGIQIRDGECFVIPRKEHLRRRSAATSRRPLGRTAARCSAARLELAQRAERRIAFGEPVERLIALVQREAARSSSSPRPGSSTSTVDGPLARASEPTAPLVRRTATSPGSTSHHPGRPHSALSCALSRIPGPSTRCRSEPSCYDAAGYVMCPSGPIAANGANSSAEARPPELMWRTMSRATTKWSAISRR